MMNPEIKALWIDALRSGEFEQGTGRLRSERDEYCCLGVLSELAHRSGVEIETIFRPTTMSWLYDGSSTNLTGPTLKWSGIAYRNGAFDLKEDVRTNLVELNDNYFTFAQLADVIEYFF